MSEKMQPLQQARPSSDPEALVRKACLADVAEMYRIINYYADMQRMLPKTELQLYENLRDYSIVTDAVTADLVLGCGALHIYWENLAEIRALAVDPEMTRKRLGSVLVESLLSEARGWGIKRVFCFTYEPKFFGRFGFTRVEHRELPLKVYNECFHCPKFNSCDEIAMVLDL
ncbi:MAG: N-acetyltransferase [Acidobacteria bacterium]|nr:N-acetyltransferase [Acidobacteriota bacterium]